MEEKIPVISPHCKRRLMTQGYLGYSDKELNDFKFGFRFAYGLCTLLFATGLALNNIPLLIIAASVAFVGTIPPYHPFDYLYNYVIRKLLNKPKIPARTNQGRFACGIAAVWITMIIYLFFKDYQILAFIMGGILLTIASLVSILDICIPSMIYNFLFLRSKTKAEN